MKDLAIALDDRPGALAEMGEALGRAGVSIEGGGVFEGGAARKALGAARIRVVQENEVVIVRLRQSEPGQLGRIARRMADAGVNIEVQYSDHDHQLILVVDDIARAKTVAEEWMRSR